MRFQQLQVVRAFLLVYSIENERPTRQKQRPKTAAVLPNRWKSNMKNTINIAKILCFGLLGCPAVAYAHGNPMIVVGAFAFALIHLAFIGYLLLSDSLKGFRIIALTTFIAIDYATWYWIGSTRMNGWFISFILSVLPTTGVVFYPWFAKKRRMRNKT